MGLLRRIDSCSFTLPLKGMANAIASNDPYFISTECNGKCSLRLIHTPNQGMDNVIIPSDPYFISMGSSRRIDSCSSKLPPKA